MIIVIFCFIVYTYQKDRPIQYQVELDYVDLLTNFDLFYLHQLNHSPNQDRKDYILCHLL